MLCAIPLLSSSAAHNSIGKGSEQGQKDVQRCGSFPTKKQKSGILLFHSPESKKETTEEDKDRGPQKVAGTDTLHLAGNSEKAFGGGCPARALYH